MFGHAGMVLALGSIFALGSAVPVARAHGTTERVSVSSDGAQGNKDSFGSPAISSSGRFVAFKSDATNLVPGDTNRYEDVFVHDRKTGNTRRVSVTSGGAQGNGSSFEPVISAGGRFVAFGSFATNLVPGDTNDYEDVFVHDRRTGKTWRVSVSSGGSQGNVYSYGPAISPGGRFVAFSSSATNLVPRDTNDSGDVFVHDRRTGTTERVSVSSDGAQGNQQSSQPAISPGGRFVAFSSQATKLVPGDTNRWDDVFVHDRRTGTTERVSVSSGGAQGNKGSGSPTISPGGRFVAFSSAATNLVPGDTNGLIDVFVRDRRTGTTERVSVGSGGTQGDHGGGGPAAISSDGRSGPA